MANAKVGQFINLRNMLLCGVLYWSAGCSVFRGVEQWKCDNLGMCHFGTQPSVAAPSLPPPECNPTGCPPY